MTRFSRPALPTPDSIYSVEQLLTRLEGIDPKLRMVVDMRVFEGMTHEEIAARLGCTSRTVGTYWTSPGGGWRRRGAMSPSDHRPRIGAAGETSIS